MNDALVAILNAIGAGVSNETLGQLTKSPADFNTALYSMSGQISVAAVKPVASVVLAIIFAIELSRTAARIDGDQQLGVKIVAATMFKLALVFIAAQNADLFIKAINDVNSFVLGKMQGVASVSAASGAANLGDQMKDSIDAAGWGGQAGLLVLMLIPFLASQIANVVFTVVCFMVFIQLYLLGAFSCLPIAFIASEETKQMGIAFFRRYASTVFQLSVLWLGTLFYRVMMSTAIKAGEWKNVDLWGYVINNYGAFLMGSVLLIFLVMASSQVSKSIMGE